MKSHPGKEPLSFNTLITTIWNADFIITSLIIPSCFFFLCSLLYVYFSNRFLPNGVTVDFFSSLNSYILYPIVGLLGILGISFFTNKPGQFFTPGKFIRLQWTDLILLLFPITPIEQYIVLNLNRLDLWGTIFILFFFILISGFFVLILPALLAPLGNVKILRAIGISFISTVTFMPLLSHTYGWWERGALNTQLTFIAGTFLVILILSCAKNKWVLLIPVIGFFSTNLITQESSRIMKIFEADRSPLQSQLPTELAGKTPKTTPNVYVLIYDAYAQDETMQSYGIDNSHHLNFLQEKGFQLYPDVYSLYADTLHSMGSVFSVSGYFTGRENYCVSGYGEVFYQFKELGYKTYGIFPTDFMVRDIEPNYDYYFPRSSTSNSIYLIASVLVGEFRFDIGSNAEQHRQFVDQKQEVLKIAAEGKSLVYIHTDRPSHSQNSGACLPDEIDLYSQRLSEANGEMTVDVESVIRNDPSAIIIVAGDHGPYLTKNCTYLTGYYKPEEVTRLDIQDRHGTFLAIRWPERADENIEILQDIFPAVFSYMYADGTIRDLDLERVIPQENAISGVSVKDGIIEGGLQNGQSLFVTGR